MCSSVPQSTSIPSLIDSLARKVQDLHTLEVFKYDVQSWINGTTLSYTFQFVQYRSTWSWVDRIYGMCDETFLTEELTMYVYQGVCII